MQRCERKNNSSKAGSLVFNKLTKNDIANPNTWWKFIEGANWKHPQGPNSSIEGKDNFPVVHISWYDAQAYAKFYGKTIAYRSRMGICRAWWFGK
ncbi:MAG: SUMF1/EgtB/PvdO family nonheme iron enzyme [Saprospirales bacterium]|nr:SUMF1/EgtB/PvdO family nonheme iron enzyme [Saprospirales bacterium]